MNRRNNNLNLLAIISSVLIVLGCLLPWVQIGHVIQIRGIDNYSGALILVMTVITGVVSINNNHKSLTHTWTYIAGGMLTFGMSLIAIIELVNKVEKVLNGMNELQRLVGTEATNSFFSLLGSGLIIVVLGALGLLIAGFSIDTDTQYLSKINKLESNSSTLVKPIIKDVVPEDDEKYKRKVFHLFKLIKEDKNAFFAAKNTLEISEIVNELCHSKEDGVYLIETYSKVFKKDLINDLKKTSSSYNVIETVLSPSLS